MDRLKLFVCACGKETRYSPRSSPICSACRKAGRKQSEAPPPYWVRFVKRLRKPEDRGIGDTVQRMAAWLGGERFKLVAAKLGIPCGCTQRQSEWNERWPY